MKNVQIYLGVPQTDKLLVFEAQQGQQVAIKHMIFTNTSNEDAKITLTINTMDIIKDVIAADKTKMQDTLIVLNPGDKLFIKQEKVNAINVAISGTAEPVQVGY